MTTTPKMVKGERWYVDGEPGTVYSEPYPTGYFTFHFDGAGFATNMNTNDTTKLWRPCSESAAILQTRVARKSAAEKGIKI